jgi:hypothetical protein
VVRRRLDWRAYGGRAGRTGGPPGARHVRLDDEGDTCAAKNEVHRGRIHLGKRRSLSAEHRAAHGADAEVRARRAWAQLARFGFAEPRFEHN